MSDIKKKWLSFSDLYPCTVDDPLQVFMKHKLQMKAASSSMDANTLVIQKDAFFQRHAQNLFFVSKQTNYARFQFFDNKFRTSALSTAIKPLVNYFSVPIYNVRAKLKMTVDLIVTKDMLSVIDPTWKHDDDHLNTPVHVVVCLVQSTKITPYQRYQAHFLQKIMGPYASLVDMSHVFYFDMNNMKLSALSIEENELRMYQKKISRDCKWVRNCMNEESVFTLHPPSHPYLYPNMKVDCKDVAQQQWKSEYAKQLNEITLLWKCTVRQRETMHNKGIYDFLHPAFQVEDLALRCHRDAEILQHMLDLYTCPDTNIYVPHDIVIAKKDYEMYVDFETLNDIIYWIGVGHYDGKEYKSLEFVSRSPTLEEQERIMTEFRDWLVTFRSKTVYYWWAEERFWHRSEKLMSKSIDMDFTEWVDLCKVFSQSPVLVKNCFNFKLKTIAKEMKRMNMIDIVCPQECSNGSESMVVAERYFQHYSTTDYRMLKEYNYFDCRVMFEILSYLKKILTTTSSST